MYSKKKSTKKNVLIILSAIGIVFFIVVSFQFARKITIIENGLKTVSSFANEILFSPLKLFNSQKDIDQSESYLIQKNVNSSLEKEITELRELLELNRSLTEYKPINATILSRNKSYWFNNMMIDKGTKDGIKEGMAVITKNGLVGKISKVYTNSSEIKLITSDDINYKVSVSIKANDSENIAILNGYDVETGLIRVIGVNKTASIEVGDTVLTSGLGGVFPGGIYIGVVESIESDKYDLSNNIYIKTSQDFNNIHYVTILGEKK